MQTGRAALASATLGALGLTFAASAACAGDFTIIHKFVAGSAKGYVPSGELSFGDDGALYGVTSRGGKACPTGDGACGGTVYRLAPPEKGSKWSHEVLHSFAGGPVGAAPKAGVTVAKGTIIGSTTYGGKVDCTEEPHGWGCGTFWQMLPPDGKNGAWKYDVFYTLPGGTGLRLPDSEFTRSGDQIVGSTQRGGRFDKGAFLVLVPSKSKPDGGVGPQSVILEEGCKIIWELEGSTELEQPVSIFDFFDQKKRPSGPVIYHAAAMSAGDDDCVGATNGCGGVGSLSAPGGAELATASAKKDDGWSFTVNHSFLGAKKGGFPISGGGEDEDGVLYGSAYGGVPCKAFINSLGCGVIYRMTPPPKKGGTWGYEVIYSFKGGKDGDRPIGRMALDKAGRLYGVTTYGGKCAFVPNGGCGTIWRLTPPKKKGEAWKHEVLHAFDAATDGKWPSSGLTRAGDDLFGATDRAVYRLKS